MRMGCKWCRTRKAGNVELVLDVVDQISLRGTSCFEVVGLRGSKHVILVQ